MATSQSPRSNPTVNVDNRLDFNVNNGFANFDVFNGNPKDDESTKLDDMVLKSTIVSVEENGALLKKKLTLQKPFRCQCIICTLVSFLLLAAFLVVLLIHVNKLRESDEKVCLTDICIRRSAVILEYMNKSVNPCEDFYSFACERWQANTFIPTTQTEVHVLWNINEENKKLMRNLLADSATKTKYASNRAVTKALNYYHTCLSKATINRQGDRYLKEVIATLGGSKLTTPNWSERNYDVNKAILMAFTRFGVQPFFSVSVRPDFKNSSKKSFAISDGGVTLDTTFYFEKNSSEDFYEKTRLSYRQYMIDVMVLFGADRINATKQMEQVYLLEEKIATIIRRHKGWPQSSTILELINYTKFDWFSFLSGLAANQSFVLSRREAILVRTKDVIKGVIALMNSTNKETISNYIAWVAIEAVIRFLPDPYVHARLQYKQRIYGLSYEDKERWDFCYEATKKYFPMPLGLMYVEKKLDSRTKTRAKEIFEEIRREFLLELNDQTWMDNETKERAKAKAKASTILVGYSDYIKDEEKLNVEYERISVNASEFLKSVFSIRSAIFLKSISEYKRPVDRNAIIHSPVEVNAYHYRSENKNVFLAGILRAPFYDDDNLRASNYGGIGMVAGHELTHGFDSNGRLHDERGNLRNWWSRNATKEFQRKSQCFQDQYGQFEMYGKKINGKKTLGENIADNGGIKFAYEAYKRWVSRNGHEAKLPGLNYTPYQLFFISYAQGWCSKYTRQGAFHQIDNLPWPPMNIRVQGVIMNSKGFAEAFQCPKGSPMNPVKKCSLW